MRVLTWRSICWNVASVTPVTEQFTRFHDDSHWQLIGQVGLGVHMTLVTIAVLIKQNANIDKHPSNTIPYLKHQRK